MKTALKWMGWLGALTIASIFFANASPLAGWGVLIVGSIGYWGHTQFKNAQAHRAALDYRLDEIDRKLTVLLDGPMNDANVARNVEDLLDEQRTTRRMVDRIFDPHTL